MKKTIFLIVLIFSLFACTLNIASGKWENVVKNTNGTIVTTTMTISESFDEFTGSLNTKASGADADKILGSTKDLTFSGYISGKTLVITKLDTSAEGYFRSSTLTISDDGKTLVLAPGGMIFNKK